MVETTLKVRHPLGLHARPAVKFVQTAASFRSKVEVANLSGANKKIDAKSILGILSINVMQNQEIVVTADGPDEEQALVALTELVEDNFGESDDLETRRLSWLEYTLMQTIKGIPTFDEHSIKYGDPQIGIMIEIPAVAVRALVAQTTPV